MSREIKFRAMVDGKIKNLNGFVGCSLSYFFEINSRESPVMQYTGLKDKNGVEIYEGDILDINSPVMGCGKSNVKYENGSFRLGCGPDLLGGYLTHEIEVIGNIYENKDLLND